MHLEGSTLHKSTRPDLLSDCELMDTWFGLFPKNTEDLDEVLQTSLIIDLYDLVCVDIKILTVG